MATAMRQLTYEDGLVKSFVSTILYLAMVYYLVKFIIIYFKRLFVTVILILLGPFMGVKFAIDRLKYKSSTAFTNWAKEYIFSVGTQTIHALVYTIFVGMSYKIATSSDVAAMATCVLAFMFFRFMTEAEKMLRGFLKLTGDTASNIMGDAESTDIKEIFGLPILARMSKYAKITPIPGYVRKKYETGKKYMRNNMENEYVKMRRNELIEKYGEAYKPDERGRRTEVTSNIDNKIETILKAEFKDKLDSAVERTGTGWKVLRNSGQIVVGLPIAVVENTMVGTGVVLAGIHTLYNIADGKITKYKKYKEEVKLRADSKTTKKVQRWLDLNATQKVATEFKKQYGNQETKEKAENRVKLDLLHQARQAELNLQYEIAKQKEGLLKEEYKTKNKPEEDSHNNKTDKILDEDSKIRIQNELAKQHRRNLKRSVEDALKTVDRKNIQKAVKDYMKANNKYTLSFKDMEIIADQFDVRFEKGELSELQIENQVEIDGFIENVKLEAKAEFVRDIVLEDQINEQTIITEEALDQVKNNIEEKMKKTENTEEKESMSLAIKCIDDKRHEIKGENKQKTFSNLSKEEQNKVMGIIEEATDDNTAEQYLTNKGKKDAKEIVNTMKKAVDKDGSIKKDYPDIPEFKPIIEEVYHLKEINELSRETTGKPIYQDIGKLVENMVNNTNVKLNKQEQK